MNKRKKFRESVELNLSKKEARMVIGSLRDQASDIELFDSIQAAAMRQLADHIEREVS